ncbi:uncharacterized protein HD556DRAFT_1308708 [Suillus plorans]|uniref:Uncharacterized protein n=1 Tax=Suillus plorans TaxID=116603 RepID=A0A9P7AQ22_9AGAM|nr:uncharacterized protein HD556DRAFT_1308708 [Suillus plorans]KAG1793267.1 hypothetical protein HD556DRAFT_1308708 [Suillus plorans]
MPESENHSDTYGDRSSLLLRRTMLLCYSIAYQIPFSTLPASHQTQLQNSNSAIEVLHQDTSSDSCIQYGTLKDIPLHSRMASDARKSSWRNEYFSQPATEEGENNILVCSTQAGQYDNNRNSALAGPVSGVASWWIYKGRTCDISVLDQVLGAEELDRGEWLGCNKSNGAPGILSTTRITNPYANKSHMNTVVGRPGAGPWKHQPRRSVRSSGS